jgi:hypothetical protein
MNKVGTRMNKGVGKHRKVRPVAAKTEIRVVIEVPDSERAQVVRADEPFLTDAFIHDMYGVLTIPRDGATVWSVSMSSRIA